MVDGMESVKTLGNPDLGNVGTFHLDNTKPRDFHYFDAMNQRKQEPGAFAYFGAMQLDNQFLFLFFYCKVGNH